MKSFKEMLTKVEEAMSGKRVFDFSGVDEIGDFWVVIKPNEITETEVTEPTDILFKADVFDIALQMEGGLKGSEIVGIYKSKGKAKKIAEKLIKKLF